MKWLKISGLIIVFIMAATSAFAAYHHEGEKDAPQFLLAYPDIAGTKLDQCQLCHTGGTYKGSQMGSCQYCHAITNYGRISGQGDNTLNQYGRDYRNYGRNAAAVFAIDALDSDGDSYTNTVEINNMEGSEKRPTYPGNAADYPGLIDPPQKVYTKDMLGKLRQHTQFMLQNANRSVDFYAEYTGVSLRVLLNDAGILQTATGVTVYSPDGFAMSYSLYNNESSGLYPVYDKDYKYPPSIYYYNSQADASLETIIGWCDYSAPSCIGRSNGDPIFVTAGLKAMLATKREGVDLDVGHLTADNKLDGEGPYRIVVPQKAICAPDQSQKSSYQNVIWPWSSSNDHNAGYSARTATIIKVEPLPQGCTDIDVYEAGWDYVDQKKIVVYGSIDPDSPVPQDPDDETVTSSQISKSLCLIATVSSNETGFSLTGLSILLMIVFVPVVVSILRTKRIFNC
ncbi:MAG TPA: GEGP motif-containing diheme protein [Desulfomonilia bacterium]